MLGRLKLDNAFLTLDQGNFNQITTQSRNRTLVTVVRDMCTIAVSIDGILFHSSVPNFQKTRTPVPTPNVCGRGAAYKISCSDCYTRFKGETNRNLCIPIKEYQRCLISEHRTNNVAVHFMQIEHKIDWNNGTCLANRTNYFGCIFLESWYP